MWISDCFHQFQWFRTYQGRRLNRYADSLMKDAGYHKAMSRQHAEWSQIYKDHAEAIRARADALLGYSCQSLPSAQSQAES